MVSCKQIPNYLFDKIEDCECYDNPLAVIVKHSKGVPIDPTSILIANVVIQIIVNRTSVSLPKMLWLRHHNVPAENYYQL